MRCRASAWDVLEQASASCSLSDCPASSGATRTAQYCPLGSAGAAIAGEAEKAIDEAIKAATAKQFRRRMAHRFRWSGQVAGIVELASFESIGRIEAVSEAPGRIGDLQSVNGMSPITPATFVTTVTSAVTAPLPDPGSALPCGAGWPASPGRCHPEGSLAIRHPLRLSGAAHASAPWRGATGVPYRPMPGPAAVRRVSSTRSSGRGRRTPGSGPVGSGATDRCSVAAASWCARQVSRS